MNNKQLPPLPDPHIGLPWRHNAPDGSIHSSAFTAEQMREYALQAIAHAAQPAEVTDEQIIAIKKATKAADPTQQWGDTLAFARAILALRPVQVPMTDGVRERALDLLATLFDAYENGPACYESPDDCAGYLGNAVQIDHDTFHVIASLLNTHRPIIPAQAKKETL